MPRHGLYRVLPAELAAKGVMNTGVKATRSSPLVVAIAVLLLSGWAAWVMWHYRLVDGQVLTLPSWPVFYFFGLGGLVVGLIGGLAGLVCRKPLHLVRTSAAFCTLVAALSIGCFKFIDTVLAQPDFVRIPGILFFGAAGGVGFTLVLRRSSFHRGLLGTLLVFPFAALSCFNDRGASFLCVVMTLVAATGLGRTIQDRFVADVSIDQTDTGLLVSIRLALGLLSLSMLGFVLGILHLAYPTVIFSAVVLTIILTRREIVREIRSWRDQLLPPAAQTGTGHWISGATWALLLIGWVAALVPEVGPDALGGRQAVVGLWAADHALAGYREMILSYMAAGGETLYLTLFPLAGQHSAKIGQWIAVLASLPALLGLVRHRTVAAKVLPLAFGASSIVLVQFAWGFVDLVQSLFYFCALGCGWLWWRQPRSGMLLLAALLAAGATAVKLNGLGAPLILGAIVFAKRCREPRAFPQLARDGIFLTTGFALILGPWFLRSYLLSGNPIFPYANGIFASPLAPASLIAARYGDPIGIGSLVQFPWRVIMEPSHFGEIGTYHPLLLIVLPLLVMALLYSGSRYWIVTGLAAGLLWFVTEQNTRYSLFAVFPIVYGLSLWLDWWLADRPGSGKTLTTWLAAILFFSGSYAQIARPNLWLFLNSDGAAMPLSVALGRISAEDYLTTQLRHVPLLRHADRTAGSKAVIWELPWMRDHLHLAGHAIALPHCDQRLALRLRPLLDLTPSGENFRQIHATLRELGITHLLLPPESPWAPVAPDRPYSAIYSRKFLHTATAIEAANYGYLLLSLNSEVRDRPRVAPGTNLFINPEFKFSTDVTKPDDWIPSAPLTAPKNAPLFLPAGVTLYQPLQVQPNRLYQLEVKFPAGTTAAQGAVIWAAWRDTAGRLVLYQTYSIAETDTAGLASFFQTAPDSASRLEITVRGPLSLIAIAMQIVDAPLPSTTLSVK